MAVANLTAAERETTITRTDDRSPVTINTTIPRDINAMRRHPKFRELASGHHGGTEWAIFSIAWEDWSPATGAKRASRKMTEEQREAAATRLKAAREATSGRYSQSVQGVA